MTSRQNVDTPIVNRQRDRTSLPASGCCIDKISAEIVGSKFYQFWALGPMRDASSIFFILFNINAIIIGRTMHGSSDIRLTWYTIILDLQRALHFLSGPPKFATNQKTISAKRCARRDSNPVPSARCRRSNTTELNGLSDIVPTRGIEPRTFCFKSAAAATPWATSAVICILVGFESWVRSPCTWSISQGKKRTPPAIPAWSPTAVLSRPNGA